MSRLTLLRVSMAFCTLLSLSAIYLVDALVPSGVPPIITVQPTDQIVSGENATLRLNCSAQGDPTPSLSFYRGALGEEGEEVGEEFLNREVDNSTEPTTVELMLEVTGVTTGQEASREGVAYHCRASSVFGTVVSETATVFSAYFDGFTDEATTKVTQVISGRDVAFYCGVGPAVPAPVIEWVNGDGDVVMPQDTGTPLPRYLSGGRYLAFGSVTDTQNLTTYRCQVTNALGSTVMASSTVHRLVVGIASNVSVFKPLEDVTAFEGQANVRFEMILSRETRCTYRVGTATTSHTTVGPFAEITNPLTLGMDGLELRCTIGGEVLGSSFLNVVAGVEVTAPSNDLDNFVSDSKTFTCNVVSGHPAPEGVRWFFNGGEALPDGVQSDGNTLNIDSMQVAHSGIYQCLVSNSVSSQLHSWALSVREPELPAIDISVAEKDEIVSNEGEPLLLTVMVTADPAPSVRWLLNGTLLQQEQKAMMESEGVYSSSFNITSLSPEVSGYYQAVFSNRAGSAMTSPVFVSVPVPAQVFDLRLNSTCLEDGTDVVFVCEGYGRPLPKYEFVKDNELVVSDGRVVLDTFTLLILNVEATDDGTYSCRISGQPALPPATKEGIYCKKPEVTVMDEGSYTEGENVKLTCNSTGVPSPSLMWFRSSRPVNEMDHIDIEQSEGRLDLDFVPIMMSDAGVYTCNATTLAGTDSASTQRITVTEKPGFPIIAIILIAVGGAIVLGLLFLLLCCVLCIVYRQGKKSHFPVVMGTLSGDVMADYPDGRGNVDVSDDEEEGGEGGAEAFNPEYESLPALRPAQPPQYKPTPNYPHGAPLQGDDMEMTKVPPPDSDSEFLPTSYPKQDNGSFIGGYPSRPAGQDYVSEDAQFV